MIGLAAPLHAQDTTLNPAGQPNFGSAILAHGFLPDPFIITLSSGGNLDVSTLGLGGDCKGFATSQPDFRVQWNGDGTTNLRIFFVGGGDATLIVNRPDGQWMCNDDSFDGTNPTVDITGAPAGQYNIWVGSFAAATNVPGYLMFTEVDSYPGRIISPLLGQVVNPQEEGASSTGTLTLDMTANPNYGTAQLAPGFGLQTVGIASGGSVDISAANLGADCRGFATASPDYRVVLSGSVARLRIFFVSDGDTTLAVNAADGTWHCNDDFIAQSNYNPMVEFTNAPGGQYDIWVGSFNTGTSTSGTLYVTEQDFTPANPPPA